MPAPEPPHGVPPVPLWLGAGGLIPFILFAGAVWVLPDAYQALAYSWLRTYSAVILSFVGALHWGIAMVHRDVSERDRDTMMMWSVMPALVGWGGMLLSQRPGLAIVAAMFIAHYSMDKLLVTRVSMPAWYIPLRRGLTFVVVVCLIVAILK